MPKVSVYLSEDLYRRAKEQSLPISSIAQEAIESALRRRHNDEWVRRMRERPQLTNRDFDISELMAEVRDEFGT
ncbi:MAG: type II toxin-antitoxin system CcdA family antitoxin [Actinomycetes bacterium]